MPSWSVYGLRPTSSWTALPLGRVTIGSLRTADLLHILLQVGRRQTHAPRRLLGNNDLGPRLPVLDDQRRGVD